MRVTDRMRKLARATTWVEQYQAWLGLPMTQEMLAAARAASEPVGLADGERTGERGLYQAAESAGRFATIRLLEDFVGMVAGVSATPQLPEASYGAKGILEREREL